MATFLDRFKQAVGVRGYEPNLRRSIQTVLLYEANRCIESRLKDMRPFQRKLALYDQLTALVEMIDFFLPHHKEEVMWRTGTSKEAMTADVAWKRMKLIEKELESVRYKIEPLWSSDKTHEMVMNEFIQKQFVSCSTSKK